MLFHDRLDIGWETELVWQGHRVGVHARRIQVGAEVVTGTSFLVFSSGVGIFSYSVFPSLMGGPKAGIAVTPPTQPPQQILEPRVTSQRVAYSLYFEAGQNIGLMRGRPFQPDQRLIVALFRKSCSHVPWHVAVQHLVAGYKAMSVLLLSSWEGPSFHSIYKSIPAVCPYRRVCSKLRF
jgi:hypothetical protein